MDKGVKKVPLNGGQDVGGVDRLALALRSKSANSVCFTPLEPGWTEKKKGYVGKLGQRMLEVQVEWGV